ncbi:SNF2 helicase associated domain-containing protein [Paenibacillus allorhizosphaerae]|uniref:RNA polymerase-associated protein RapA n=1 Tax=Paenibacillus allorhizosphaerae TaxID=2849866 RepID=A0ABM8VBC7_9BACL|nr:DEAD/DEAH box helicase [Paenibacillus allorhizosphaerae]CAG7619202.1 RNA polymerase-associated protein RapA [Paenibacillus allorhizosphaerae]
MGFELTKRMIRQLCGNLSYERGEGYYHEGKVSLINSDHDANVYQAVVKGKSKYEVTVRIDADGDVDAECECPAYDSYDNYCKHIAGVLFHIYDELQAGKPPGRSYPSLLHPENRIPQEDGHLTPRYARSTPSPEPGYSGISPNESLLMTRVLGLFSNRSPRPSGMRTRFDARTPLDVEFICKLFPYGYRKHMFGVELKVGPKRLYIVQKIRDFLSSVERREAFTFTKQFLYEPELHCFQEHDDAVIRTLIEILHHEKMYRESSNPYAHPSHAAGGDRMLLIPPFLWDTLLPRLLEASSVKLEQGGKTFDGIILSDEPLPLRFEFDQARSDGYELDIHGLDDIIVMESYGAVLHDGKLLKLQEGSGRQLTELKQMLETSRKQQIRIPPEQMEPFMEKVVPGLMKLGSVRIAQAVSDRIVQSPLKARLYLDRVKDRLLAGLEFQYGDIVVNPLDAAGSGRGEGRILMRDGEREAQILYLMEQSDFAQTESGYFLDDEDAEYEFLYHTVPQLEKLADIYATTAVKERLYVGNTPPKVTVNVDERTDWLEFKFDLDGIPEAEIRKLLQSLDEKRRYYRLPNGALMPLETAEFQEIVRFMNEVGLRQQDLKAADIRLPAIRGLRLIDAEKQGHAVKLGKSFRQLLDNMRNPDNLDFPVPEPLVPVLRDYQKYGFQWMKTLAYYRFGGILADDMGLGKTLQSIAFLVSVLPGIREEKLPAVIVCPASLVYNWRNELKKFAPDIRAVIADGSKAERSHAIHEAALVDVIITSYPLLRRDIELYTAQPFHTLILDEAQAFKNHATQTAHAVKSIQARYRFALTGTPVENSLEELWSLFDAVFPELFPGRKAFNELSRETVARRARPFLLRRVKSDVLKELPEKIETLQASDLLPDQKKLYAAYLSKLQQETLKHLNAEAFHKNRIKILAGLTRLRQLCCHPALFVEDYAGSSAKFEQLLEIVEECISAGKRMLVFSQFTEMLALIGRELGYRGVPFFYLDGQTPSAERVELCSKFNDGARDLFLISLKAGGTGLNLTGADTVILYDLWWNPAVEQQAADRAHRIGQKNVVQVIRLVTQGTVEEKMYELQQKKKHLIEEVIQPGQESLSTLTEADLREILMI